MTAGELFELLRDVDDDVRIVVEGRDHSYWDAVANERTACFKNTDRFSPAYTEDPNPGGKLSEEEVKLWGKRVNVLVVRVGP